MRPLSSLGIYITGDRIDLVSVRKSFQGVHVKAALSLKLPEEGSEDTFYEKLGDFIRETKSERARITLGLSRKETMLFTLDLPSPAEENLRSVLGYELDSISPYSSEEAYFDFQIMARDEKKKTIRILLVVVPKKRLDHCLEILEKAKLQPDKVEISATALVRIFLYDRKGARRGRRALLYSEKGYCEVVLVDKGGLSYSRALPSASSEQKDEVCAGLDNLLKNKGWDKGSLDEIILSGEIKEDNTEIRQEMEEKTGCKTTILRKLHESSGGEGLSPQFLVPFGLSLEGLVKERLPINLLPRSGEIKKERRRVQAVLPLVFLVVLLGSAILVTPLVQRKKVLAHLSQEINRLQIENSGIEKLEREVTALEEKLGQLILLRGNRHKMLELTNVLTRLIPENTWLTDLRVKNAAVVMTGYSESSSALIPLLEGSPLFGKVGFSAPVMVTRRKQDQQPWGFDEGFDPYSFPFAEGEAPPPSPIRGNGIEEFKIKADLEDRP